MYQKGNYACNLKIGSFDGTSKLNTTTCAQISHILMQWAIYIHHDRNHQIQSNIIAEDSKGIEQL